MKKIKPWLAVWASMALLALAHFRDVRRGIDITGDGWLASWYTVLVFVIFLGAGAAGVLFLNLAGKRHCLK